MCMLTPWAPPPIATGSPGAPTLAALHRAHVASIPFENLDIPLSYRDIKKSERESMVCDILDKFAIVGKKDLYPNQLSGGQQQLVGVARAVVAKPRLILADEPTGNLHSAQAREIMELFRGLNREGTTIVQVTHSEDNAKYSRRIVQVKDGWMVKEDGR